MYYDVKGMQTSGETGTLQVIVTTKKGNHPIPNAIVKILHTGDSMNIIGQITSNSFGQTESIDLPAPPLEYSLDAANLKQPYTEYTLLVSAEGFHSVEISGSQIFPSVHSIQPVVMESASETEPDRHIIIPHHTLYGNYPPKIAEMEIKSVDISGQTVLEDVTIPEIIIVHDGFPTDSSAANYCVPYPEYIKNVASSEIYDSWPESAIVANILAIISFTLNRTYTQWYRHMGYDFTVTSSTAFDHKWVHGRNIFSRISLIVDEIFDQYLARPNAKQPVLTQYCNGNSCLCPNLMAQWHSKMLGDRGCSPIEILRSFYGDDIYIRTAKRITGVPASWPGYNLDIPAAGDEVRLLQEQLNSIAELYSIIPHIPTDGIYGAHTKEAVDTFQSIFHLPVTGITDFRTWYKIAQIYAGIRRTIEIN